MKTVLGLSVTAAGVGWVLVDGTAPGADPLDDDRFTIRDLDELQPRCIAAVRGAAAIAASSGRPISAIGVCWSDEVQDRMPELLAELRTAGCSDVRPVRQVSPVTRAASEAPTKRTTRIDPYGLFTDLLAAEAEVEVEAQHSATLDRLELTGGSEAGQTSAYAAGQAVVTDAAPTVPIPVDRPRRTWTPPKMTLPAWRPRVPAVPSWRLPVPAGRATTVAAAAAVTALVGLFAVGSQFAGSSPRQPAETALAGSASTAETTSVVSSAPPAAQPMAAAPKPAPVPEKTTTPPVQMALPQPRPVTSQPSVTVEAPVSAEPLAAPQAPVAETVPVPESVPVPEAVPAVPEPPVVAVDPAVPAAAPLPGEPVPAAPPADVLAPAPVAPPPPPPPPFWLLPPFEIGRAHV